MTPHLGVRRRTIATAAGLVVGATAYLLTLLQYGTDLSRTANGLGYASNYFDIQGRALLDGHLWIPSGSLGIEGFVERGHEYMYFGPWPSLIRLPVLSTTTEFDGQLTILSMTLGFVLLAVMASRLVWLVRDMMYPDQEVGRLEATSMAILVALVTGGTSLTYVASLPWAFHEVYAWAVPFAIGSMYWMLRVLREPTRNSICWLLVFNLGAILTRTTEGWAMCLVTVFVGIWLALGRLRPADRRAALGAVAAGLVPLAIGIAVNMLKFRHPFLFPLQDQVWTSLNPHRQAALDANGGSITGAQFFPTTFMAYFRPDGVRFVDYFPWITLPAAPARAFNGAFIDQSYRTGSITGFMPWPLLLTAWAAIVVFRPGVDAARRMLRFPLVAGVLITGGVMGYGYIAFRYTSEFVPALVLGATIGTCALNHWLLTRRRWVARAVVAGTAVLVAYSIAAHMLVGYAQAALTGGGSHLAAYLQVQHRISPGGQAPLVTRSELPPEGGSTDDIWISGDCDAVYLNTGDTYEPWQLVEERAVVVEVRVDPDATPSKVPLIELDGSEERMVSLQTNARDQARVLISVKGTELNSHWFDLLEPRTVRVGVRNLPSLGFAEVTSTPGGFAGYLPARESADDRVQLVRLRPVENDANELAEDGLEVRRLPAPDPQLCGVLE